MTKGKSYQRYPAQYKRMALLKASKDGVTANSVCKELGISFRQLMCGLNKPVSGFAGLLSLAEKMRGLQI
jgi:hypothetical protein